MSHTPGWPGHLPILAQVERVRSDGNWIAGDPLDTAPIPWGIDGRTVQGLPRLLVHRNTSGGPLPDFPGWETPRFGFEVGPGQIFMEYVPKRVPAPVQTSIFDFLDSGDQEQTNQHKNMSRTS